jgi:elongation factor G
VLAGFPVIDFKAALLDGAHHDVDSSVMAFEIAARAAFKESLAKAKCRLLEPIMKVEVVVPIEFKDDVLDDLRKRRGQVRDGGVRDGAQVIDALVPLASVFGYANTLRSIMLRPGTYTMVFDHYAPLPMPPDDDDPSAPAVALRG